MYHIINHYHINKVFIHNTIIYFFGYVFAFLAPYIINPILIKYLDPSSLSIISKFGMVGGILVSLSSLGITGGLAIFAFEFKKESFNKIISTLPFIFLLSSFIFSFIFFFISNNSFDWTIDVYLFLFFYVFFIANYNVVVSYFTVTENKKIVVSLYIINTFLLISLVYVFIVYPFQFDYFGRLLSLIIPPFLISSLFYLYFLKKKRINKENVTNKIFNWVTGIFFHTISGLVLANIDKIVILVLELEHLIVEYFFAFQFLLPTVLFSISLNNAFKPQLYRKLKEGKEGILSILSVAIILISLFHLAFYFIFKFYYDYFIDEEILQFWIYFKSLFWLFFIQNIYYPISSILFYYRKEKFISKITSIIAIFAVVFSYFILKNYDIFLYIHFLIVIHLIYVLIITFYSISTLRFKNVI